MVNLKKYNGVLKLFVIFLTLFLIVSCGKQNYQVSKIEGKQIPITENGNQISGQVLETEQSKQIEKYIKPYRNHIDKDLNTVLAYCPETLDKSAGRWQTTIGNLMADVTLKRGNTVFFAREKKNIDMCIV